MSKGNRHKRRKAFARRTAPGAPPGIVETDPKASCPVIHLIAYGPGPLVEVKLDDPAQITDYLTRYTVVWVNVDGLGDANTIRQLGKIFHLHPLALEDVVNVHQRPKVEPYEDNLFIVARMAALNSHLETEQVSMFLGKNFVLTFLQDPGDSFDPVRQRLRSGPGRMLSSGAAYLAYALLDAVIDAYFPIVEDYGDRMEAVEDAIVLQPNRTIIAQVHDLKRDLRTIRRAMFPLREAINVLSRESGALIDDDTKVYLRDCYDHTIQIIDLVETYRELGADLTDLFFSSQGNRMNQVMKVLTIIATLFMPLSFIVGVYGMNFHYMPELEWHWGYPLVWLVMIATVAGLVRFFHRKGWIGREEIAEPPPRSEGDGPPPA